VHIAYRSRIPSLHVGMTNNVKLINDYDTGGVDYYLTDVVLSQGHQQCRCGHVVDRVVMISRPSISEHVVYCGISMLKQKVFCDISMLKQKVKYSLFGYGCCLDMGVKR
jgi:hypothetical protein